MQRPGFQVLTDQSHAVAQAVYRKVKGPCESHLGKGSLTPQQLADRLDSLALKRPDRKPGTLLGDHVGMLTLCAVGAVDAWPWSRATTLPSGVQALAGAAATGAVNVLPAMDMVLFKVEASAAINVVAQPDLDAIDCFSFLQLQTAKARRILPGPVLNAPLGLAAPQWGGMNLGLVYCNASGGVTFNLQNGSADAAEAYLDFRGAPARFEIPSIERSYICQATTAVAAAGNAALAVLPGANFYADRLYIHVMDPAAAAPQPSNYYHSGAVQGLASPLQDLQNAVAVAGSNLGTFQRSSDGYPLYDRAGKPCLLTPGQGIVGQVNDTGIVGFSFIACVEGMLA